MSKSTFLIALLTCSLSALFAQVENYSAGLNGQKFDWMLFYLNEHYVDQVDADSLTEIAIRNVASQLDRWSVYQSREEVEAQMNADKGYKGEAVGFNFYQLRDTALVTYVFRDGPSEKAGLRRGDQIIKLNGKRIVKTKYKDIQAILDDKGTDEYELSIIRNGFPMEISFNKALIPWISITSAYMLTETIGYIKISKFTLKTMEEFLPALENLASKGMQELVLDLRGNSGGVKDQAVELADQFLDEGKTIYSSKGYNQEEEITESTKGGRWIYGKLAVLQDAYSASASELFIGAMQDWDRAVILGVSTYGKGLIQQSYKLGDGSNIRLTVGRYYSPMGRHLQRISDNENDWLDDYKDELKANALTSALKVPEELETKTKSGRRILAGPGGIIPDIHYQHSSDEDVLFYNDMNNAGLLYEFATTYVHEHRQDLLKQYKSVSAFMEDRIFEAFMLKDFRKFVNSRMENYRQPANFPNNVINQLKIWMTSQLWHDNAFYEADNRDDTLMRRAKEVMEGKIHDKLGITY